MLDDMSIKKCTTFRVIFSVYYYDASLRCRWEIILNHGIHGIHGKMTGIDAAVAG
jgi:hypothetical protein